uniref:Sterol regulatory element-binding protein cleavage-activating protein n=1 Tax=Panagrellus redivivus TaxID=6233 RepID=A0A7E4W6L8_PANRE
MEPHIQMHLRRSRRLVASLPDRVGRAYYDYGRLCSAHPIACLSLCIMTMLVLSYPALARVKLPISSPMEVYWTQRTPQDLMQRASDIANGISNGTVEISDVPTWLNLQPELFLQQVIVSATVEPWNSANMTQHMAVKGPLSRAFDVLARLRRVRSDGSSPCFKVHRRPHSKLLPANGCLVLSPTLFWHDDKNVFLRDSDVLNTVFTPECTPDMCPRDILLGAPTKLTGIKRSYQTNRHRTIEFAVTLVLAEYDPEFRAEFIQQLGEDFEIVASTAADDTTFVNVFYRPRKYFTDYAPLFVSYFFCMFYFYFTVSKFEMVKSMWGLAFAAFNTVFWTLAMTSGICAHLDLTPSLWGAGLYPYLAMIIGLENILCITRAVVYTNPTMDVASRLSHGLSHEGYSITKYFLLEMCFIGVAYMTWVPEIQEFCTFAVIALVIDFYMQLFFYTPCLLFDLNRLGVEEKQRFSEMLFKSDMRKLVNYPSPKCPARIIFPTVFTKKESQKQIHRTLSDLGMPKGPEIDQSETSEMPSSLVNRKQRRTVSTDKASYIRSRDSPMSFRLKIFYVWTRYRFVQRFVMTFFAVWVVWLAIVVHRWRLLDHLWGANRVDTNATLPGTDPTEGFGVSHHILETAPLEWVHWQRHTFKWWPAVFAEYNLSLSGQFVTFLPPIMLKSIVPASDASVSMSRVQFESESPTSGIPGFPQSPATTTKQPELQNRIISLEWQLAAVLFILLFMPFCFVVAFILYVLFWDRWRQYRHASKGSKEAEISPKVHADQRFYELTPLLFAKNDSAIECFTIQYPSAMVFSSLDGRVYLSGTNGENRRQLTRYRSHLESGSPGRNPEIPKEPSILDSESDRDRAQIWCIHIQHNVIYLGCSDGSVEVGFFDGRVVAKYHPPSATSGVLQLRSQGKQLIIGRLNGTIELVYLTFPDNEASSLITNSVSFSSVASTRAHDKPITALECVGYSVISAGYDRLIKVYDLRNFRHLHTLIKDDSPVMEVHVEQNGQHIYNRYDSGLISCWDIKSGECVYTTAQLQQQGSSVKAELAISLKVLAALAEDNELFLWDKTSGDFLLRLAASGNPRTSLLTGSLKIIPVGDHYVVTSNGCILHVWDVSLFALIRRVQLPLAIESLYAVGERSILAVSSTTVFKVDLP